jgi:hypothetical protein
VAIPRQNWGKHISAATNQHATTAENSIFYVVLAEAI